MPMRWLAERFMRMLGWKVVGEEPLPEQFVAIGAPHTSNWDFMLFLAVVSHFRVNAKVIGKHTLVEGPFGGFMRRMGVVPVDRKSATGIVDQMRAVFDASGAMALVVAPEGTRSRTDHWKSGFYRIALGAGVPVVCAYVDYQAKVAGFGEVIHLSGDMTADMDRVRSFYATTGVGRFPGKAGTIRLREEG